MSPKDPEALETPLPGTVLVIERGFDASRERVWMAWTVPDLFKRWWGPKGFTVPNCRISLRVGGSYLYDMRSPEGKDTWGTGFYREIVPYERLVATDSFSDEKGSIVPASVYGLGPGFPLELLLTVTFDEPKKGKTKLTLSHAGMPPGKDMEGAREGWNQSLDKLADALAADPRFKAS
jgi:uncharacterized protein YndB with AHSA1/START domain